MKRRVLVFEKALHSWKPWLDSILVGRKVLRIMTSIPSLGEMRHIANQSLKKMGFPACTLFELYWLTCVFSDYDIHYKNGGGFKFDLLLPPPWFPFPFGFEEDEHLVFKGKRIYPPEVWSEADVKFHRKIAVTMRAKEPDRTQYLKRNVPNREEVLVLPSSHPVRRYMRGRPVKPSVDGETLI